MRDLLITGGTVALADGVANADVSIVGGRITTEVARGSVLDASALWVAPGLIDLQCNGAGGIDLSTEPERLWEVAALLPRWGVTSWLPTIISSAPDVRHRAMAVLDAGPTGLLADASVATPLGLHFEGPFLSPSHRGAHPVDRLAAPDMEIAAGWSAAAGVAVVTLAPELPGALDLIRALVDRGVVVSAGHTGATAAQAEAGIDAGVRWVTHLFNAMVTMHHREPGLVGVALSDDRVRVGLIVDGVHVHPTVVALAARVLGSRLTLVTDATAALGSPPGPVSLGEHAAAAHAGRVVLDDGTLAGSDLSLDRAVRNLADHARWPDVDALAAASLVPAEVLGVRDKGRIEVGADGDLVLLDGDLEVVATVVGGSVAFDRRQMSEPR